MALEEEVSLDISEALRQVDSLEEALTASAQQFKIALADALDVLQVVKVEDVDATAVTAGIDSAVASADTDVQLEADAAPVTTAIDDAINASDKDVPLDAITSAITDDINASIAAADTTIEVDADTSQAQDALDELSGSGGRAQQAVGGAGEALSGFAQNAGVAAAAARGAAGDTSALGGAVGGLNVASSAGIGIVGALAFATKEFTAQALDADQAQRRFNATFGDLADRVENINIPGLNTDIKSLALELGSDDDKLRDAAASIGQIGLTSGKTREEVALTAQEIVLLAARATALNPQLGTADEIAGRLGGALARGGRFASQFGISLTSAQIAARALSDTNKTNVADLTQYEKAAAGAALATEQLGNHIATDIAEGAKSPLIQLRSLKQAVLETFEATGTPLIDPLIDAFKELTPVLQDAAEGLGPVLLTAINLLGPALRIVDPLVKLLAIDLEALSKVVDVLIGKPLEFLASGFEKAADFIGLTAEQTDPVAEGLADTEKALGKTGSAADDTGQSFDDLTVDMSETEDQLNALVDAQIAYLDSSVGAEQANVAFSDSLRDLTDKQKALTTAIAEHGAKSDEAAAAQRDLDAAITGARDKALSAAEAQLRLADDTATAEGKTLTSEERQKTFRDTLEKLAAQATGPTRDAILGLIAQLDNVAKVRTATVVANVDSALTETGKLEKRLENIKSLFTQINSPKTTSGSQGIIDLLNPQRMAGGPIVGPAVVDVGERGRERVFIGAGQSGFVTNGSQTGGLDANNAAAQAAFVDAMNAFTRAQSRSASTRSGPIVGQLVVQEVTQDPETTGFAVAAQIGQMSRR